MTFRSSRYHDLDPSDYEDSPPRLSINFYDEETDLEFTVGLTADVSAYHPAITTGPADNWAPEEGGDVEGWELDGVDFKIDIDNPEYFHLQLDSKESIARVNKILEGLAESINEEVEDYITGNREHVTVSFDPTMGERFVNGKGEINRISDLFRPEAYMSRLLDNRELEELEEFAAKGGAPDLQELVDRYRNEPDFKAEVDTLRTNPAESQLAKNAEIVKLEQTNERNADMRLSSEKWNEGRIHETSNRISNIKTRIGKLIQGTEEMGMSELNDDVAHRAAEFSAAVITQMEALSEQQETLSSLLKIEIPKNLSRHEHANRFADLLKTQSSQQRQITSIIDNVTRESILMHNDLLKLENTFKLNKQERAREEVSASMNATDIGSALSENREGYHQAASADMASGAAVETGLR